ncbi:hypothetical protein BDR06DRAFT_997877 [Suillus hirtellus]|nr:hypothetical protein BDR06DRAFT_997877 [Suillus hirtellus]
MERELLKFETRKNRGDHPCRLMAPSLSRPENSFCTCRVLSMIQVLLLWSRNSRSSLQWKSYSSATATCPCNDLSFFASTSNPPAVFRF